MKSIRLKLLIAVLVMFSFTFFMSIGSTKAIYREVKSTTINLTVISSNDCLIQFNSNGGSSVANRYVSPNTAIGTLPIPTKSGYNFAGWYDSNNQRVRHSTVITSDTDLHAVWTEIVCKLVTDENNLHNETCQGGGCAVSGTGFNTSNNNTITYGTIGNGVPISGDAYNCDVDYNGIYDEKESDNLTFIERFYFVRTKTNTNTEDSAVMYYSTSFDSTGRNNRTQSKTDIESKNYTTALTYLPQATLWDNPGLINLGNGKVTRFVSDDDMEEVCGTLTFSNTSYFTSCQKWFWFENTRFQSLNMGRAGIWMEYNGGAKYHRIHSQSLNLGEVESSSENMARPVIEIPMSALEGYYDEDRFTISYNTYLGDTNPISSVLKYRGEALGPLPIPVREDYTFDNWYTDSNYQNVANPTSLVSGNTTLYANWNPILAIEVTLHLNDGTITGVTSPISMNSGELLDNLPDPEREGYTFVGWFTDSACTIPFDPTEPITASMDLYADWELIQTVTITLHLNDGTITGVTSPITINSGELLDNLPDPEREGYTFEGWFTDSACTIPFDSTQPITTDLDLYADWEEDNYVASVNGTKYTTLSAAINAVPTGKVKTTVKILKNITLTSPQSIPNTKWVELDLQNFTIDGSSGDLFRNSGYLDIINGTIVSTANIGGNNPGYVVKNVSGAILTISGGTLRYDNSASAEAKVIKNTGTVNITGGRIESNASAAAIDNMESSGTLNVTGGEIISTNTYKGQAIYIASGSTVNISGTAYIENASASSGDNARAAVDNNNGTLTITGGTIVSKNYAAVGSRNASGVTYIGINDNGGNIIDTTIPILIGGKNAIIRSNGSINVYDGVFKSGEQAAHDGNVVLLSGTEFYFDDTETISGVTYNVYYLKQSTGGPYTVTFDPLNDGINTTVVNNIQAEGTVGSSMPANPTRQNYIFVKWYINVNEDGTFTSTTPIVNNITVTAKWKPAIGSATINPLSISMLEGETETIVVTGPVGMEDYSFSSSDTSVAIVNQDGEVTAVADGTATIYITGSESNTSQTVPVSVNPIVYHTVTFYKELNGEVIKTVQVEHGTQIGSANMPANNPTKTNYVFDNWYVNGATNTPAFNASATINDDVDVIANWFETVDYATMVINPAPMNLYVGDTGTITLNPTISGDTVESYTCSSSNGSVATVNNCTVTAVGIGSTTITITGSDPSHPKTVNVTVDILKHTVIFDKNNGDQNAIITINNVEHGSNLSDIIPADPTKTDYIFDNWYSVESSTWTNNPIDTEMLVNDDLEYKAGFYTTSDVAAIGHYYYTTLANAFAAINNNSVPTNNIEILKDFTVPTDSGQNRPTINSKKVANINGNNHTITCGNENIVYNNGGTVTISNITLTCNASKTAPLNNAGTMTIIDSTASMTLTGTNGRAAVYNTGTVNIEGNSILSTVAKERSTVQNVSSGAKINISGGTITQGASDATKPAVEVVSGSSATITGGTITSTHLYGIDNAGTLVIGTKDDQYSTTSIVITGEQYGINSTANYSLYDGLIKGKSNNKAVNDESKINITEDGAVQQTGTDGDYYTLYYIIQSASPTPTPTPAPTPTPTATPTPNQLTISFDAIGVTNPSSQQVNEGSPIESLPTVTWGNKTFDGWYTDMSYTTQVTTSTIPEDDATYYAKWTYTPANSKVTYDSTNDAMDEYFDNISTWKNQNESTFATTMLTNFNNNSCSNCNAANNCDNPTSGTYCDKPKEYNTNTNSALSVFLYDETNHVIGEKVEYASLTNGKITNLIPGVTYYWEKTSDPTVNGLIEATTPRRVLDAGNVRNVRDLGGLSVTYTENNVQKTGTIKYGKLFRGAKLTSSQADVTSLEKLGVTREIDLRPDSERGGAARFTVFDNYGNSGGDIIIHNYLINRTAITYSYLDKNNNSQTTVSSYSSYADELKSALKKTMQYVIDGDNIYFHCTIGTDRTGTLAYFLEGLLGVSEEDRVEDYELTYFFGLTNRTRYHDHLDGSDINPRFTFMHVTYPSNQDIYNWFVDGDSSSELTADNNLITAFRNAMIDN